jgi:hypothetical protein
MDPFLDPSLETEIDGTPLCFITHVLGDDSFIITKDNYLKAKFVAQFTDKTAKKLLIHYLKSIESFQIAEVINFANSKNINTSHINLDNFTLNKNGIPIQPQPITEKCNPFFYGKKKYHY